MTSSVSELAPIRWFYRNVVSEPLNLILLVGGVALGVGLLWNHSCRNQKKRGVEPIQSKTLTDAKGAADLGMRQIESNNFKDGVFNLSQALGLYHQEYGSTPHPDIVKVLINLGCGYVDLGEFENALSPLQEALSMQKGLTGEEANPFLAGIYHNFGDAQIGLKRHQEGIQSYLAAIAIHEQLYPNGYDPDYASTLTNLGEVYLALKQVDGALKVYERLKELYLLGGKTEEVEVVDRKILQITPQSS